MIEITCMYTSKFNRRKYIKIFWEKAFTFISCCFCENRFLFLKIWKIPLLKVLSNENFTLSYGRREYKKNLSVPHPVRGKTLFSDWLAVWICLAHSISALKSDGANIFAQYRYLECRWYIFAALGKSAMKFKNPGRHDILMATSEWIHTDDWNFGKVAKASSRFCSKS